MNSIAHSGSRKRPKALGHKFFFMNMMCRRWRVRVGEISSPRVGFHQCKAKGFAWKGKPWARSGSKHSTSDEMFRPARRVLAYHNTYSARGSGDLGPVAGETNNAIRPSGIRSLR